MKIKKLYKEFDTASVWNRMTLDEMIKDWLEVNKDKIVSYKMVGYDTKKVVRKTRSVEKPKMAMTSHNALLAYQIK